MKNSLLIFLFITFQFTNLFPQQLALNNPNKFLDIYKTNEADSTNLKQQQKPEGPPFLFAQEFGIKAGIGFSHDYQVNQDNYYKDKLKHNELIFILTFRVNYHLFENLYLAWEPGIIGKSGKITGLALGYDGEYHDIYANQSYKLLNIENSFLLNYNLTTIKSIKLNIYFGPGITWNVYDNEQYSISEFTIINPYPDRSYIGEVKPYFNDTGTYIATGINLGYNKFQFDLRFIKDYSVFGVDGMGTYKSNIFSFLIGYIF